MALVVAQFAALARRDIYAFDFTQGLAGAAPGAGKLTAGWCLPRRRPPEIHMAGAPDRVIRSADV